MAERRQGGPGWLLGVLLAAAALVLAAGTAALRRARERVAAAELRAQRMAGLAAAAGRLVRLRDPAAVAAGGEALARDLLAADSASVALNDTPAAPPPAGAAQLMLPLRSAGGALIGRIAVWRHTGPPFDAEAAGMFAELARAVAAALDAARLLAEAMQARAEVELILGTISDGMLVLDTAWQVRYVNAAALRYLKRTRAELLGAAIWRQFPDLAGSEFARHLHAAVRHRQDGGFTAAFPPLNAWFETRCYPFEGGLTVYFRDITAQRDTEDRLRQSQRLEALGQLTGGIAHDVNNLLTVILGNLEMLALSAAERGAPGTGDAELTQAALRAGANASQLMHRLLAFSRRQALSPQAVDVGALLRTLEPLLRRSIQATVALTITAPAALWHALADPAELENALINLAINARDAMPAGGRLTIAAVNVAIDRVYAAVAGLDRIGDYVMIVAADDGTGMTPQVMEHAFDPFFTTKEPGKGTGLGLSMVYGFAQQSGGHVMIDSEPGRGSMVRLYLPRTIPATSVAPAVPAAGVVQGGGETILLVEDNDLVRAHTEALLRSLGYSVLSAADGPQALRQLGAGARPELLVTDVVLPGGLSGRQVADTAAQLVPGLRVLFTSGYPDGLLLEGGRIGPEVALLGKPFRRSEMAARVRAQLVAPPWRPPPLAADARTR